MTGATPTDSATDAARAAARDGAPVRAAVLHGAGYAGGELLALLLAHPRAAPVVVTSRSQAGQPVWTTHPRLRGQTDLAYSAPDDLDASSFDVAFVCAEHGQGAAAVGALRRPADGGPGFGGLIIDLSADHRLGSPDTYERVYGLVHPDPDAMRAAVYGLAEVHRQRLAALAGGAGAVVANPGCFATGIALALWPLADVVGEYAAHVTALTGASGSGARASATTHFPTRAGNVRAYKPLAHRHLAEVEETLGPDAAVHFVPASGPWTRGIWGTAHVALPAGVGQAEIDGAFASAYADAPLVRASPGVLPQLLPVVGTPFFDVGWVVRDGQLVVGFALDNLLKGAASQAVQNLNLVRGWPQALGLLPGVGS